MSLRWTCPDCSGTVYASAYAATPGSKAARQELELKRREHISGCVVRLAVEAAEVAAKLAEGQMYCTRCESHHFPGNHDF